LARLALSIAVGDHDRTRPPIDGVDPVVLTPSPEEILFRAFRDAPFDICELSSFTVMTAAGNCACVGVPAFLSPRLVGPDELFHAPTPETVRI
jgi:4,5-dihydroxyphthalate decarboxylase